MTTGGDALDAALGLLRAPSRRTALRWRPLPPGVTEVVSIAGGSRDSLAAACARTGYSEAELVEASRFFVQQVLFAEDASAYRVLGVASDARHAQIRDHHRLLLRWLHPDRSGEQWDSALANRVNQAWTQLRTDAARASYDAQLANAPTGSAAARREGARRPPSGKAGASTVGSPQASRAAPLVVIAVAGVCMLLAWLVIRREAELDALRDELVVAAPASTVAAALELEMEAETEPAPEPGPQPQALQPRPTHTSEPVSPAERAIASESAAYSNHLHTPTEAMAITMVAAPPIPDGQLPTSALPEIAVEPASGPPAMTIADARVVPAALSAAPAPRADQPAAAPVPASAQPGRMEPTSTRQAIDAQGAAPSHAPTAVPDTSDPLQLLREANAIVDRLATYLVSADGAGAPRYSNMPAQVDAADIRVQLQSRVGRGRQLELDTPNWRLGTSHASLDGPYRVAGRDGASESGWLHVELVREELQWQVSSLRLVPQ